MELENSEKYLRKDYMWHQLGELFKAVASLIVTYKEVELDRKK